MQIDRPRRRLGLVSPIRGTGVDEPRPEQIGAPPKRIGCTWRSVRDMIEKNTKKAAELLKKTAETGGGLGIAWQAFG